MSELHELLRGFESSAAAEARGRVLHEVAQRRVRGAITRKRRARVTVIAAAAIAASVAIGSGAWAALQYGADGPVATTTPSPTASAAPTPSTSTSPSPEPAPTMPDFSGEVTADDRLPSALPITPEAWGSAGPGWVLATYQEQVYLYDGATGEGRDEYGPQVVYLISPAGDRYELSSIEGSAEVRIEAWNPGDSSALAIASGRDGASSWVILDLTSGAYRDVVASDLANSRWTQDDLDRATWWAPRWGGENGSDLVGELPYLPISVPSADMEAARATAQSLVTEGETCADAVVLDSGDVAVACGSILESDYNAAGPFLHSVVFVSDGGRGEGVVVDITRTYPVADNEYVDSRTEAGSAITPFANGVRIDLSGVGFDPCPAGVGYATQGGFAPLSGVTAQQSLLQPSLNVFYDAGGSSSSIYTVVTGGCSGESHPAALVRDDVATGDYTLLIPFPRWWLDALNSAEFYPGDQPWPTQSITSAYVVPDWKDGAQ